MAPPADPVKLLADAPRPVRERLLAGVTDGAEVVCAFAGAREWPGAGPRPATRAPRRLAALSAARTAPLELDGLWLPGRPSCRAPRRERFARVDRPRSTNASPAVFGVARAALVLLDEAGVRVRGRRDGTSAGRPLGGVPRCGPPVPHEARGASRNGRR
ncbi:hypothetical protein [Streptomyces naganishii]|uniref:hypothetical protein n=1 Tax=Streptomyces naganishii TaxID=285447 RepID=UPI00167E6592|nr:hypothetical protein [Streptomyces naganishii]